MADRSKYGGRVILAALLLIVLIAAAIWGYNHWHKPLPTTNMPQQQAETPQGVQEAAENAGVHISQGQAEEAAQAIQEAATRPPDSTIQTTGAGVPQALQESREEAKADFQIVTDPAKPDQKPEPLRPEQPVNLNVYNVKAYPKHLLEVTVYRNAADVAYMSRVRVFGATGYVGPVVDYDGYRARGKVRVGVRLSVPID